MTTHDNAPPPIGWQPSIGNVCGGCAASANMCHVLTTLDGHTPCCDGCTHRAPVHPLRWDGDDN